MTTVPTHAVALSNNAKLGNRAAATYRGRASCPTTCPLLEAGCYAAGRIESVANRLGATDDTYAGVRNLAVVAPHNGIVRFNVVGDILGADDKPDRAYLNAMAYIASERPDVDAYTYTHAWERDDVRPGDAPGVTINASCETESELIDAAARGWPTVVVDAGGPDSLIGRTIAGRKVVQCPEQTRGISCSDCRLCARPNRRSTVAFAIHGPSVKRAGAAVRAARETGAV